MTNIQKKVVLIFLGDCIYDARVSNMAYTLYHHNHAVSIIHVPKHQKSNYSNFEFCQLYPIGLRGSGPYRYYLFHKLVVKLLKQIKKDTLVACDIFSLAAITQFKQTNNLIFDSREIYTQLSAHNNKPWYRWFWQLYEKKYIKHMNHVVVTAPLDQKYLEKLYKKFPINFSLLYNYPMVPQKNKRYSLHEYLNLPTKKQIILYQGVIQRGRGIKKLIQVVSKINNCVGVCIGSGEAQNYYKKLVSQTHLDTKIYFINHLPYEELLGFTSSADIGWLMINPNSVSNQLALPNKFFEYMIMGLPVVSSKLINIQNIPSVKQFVTFVDFNNIEQLIKSTKLLLNKKNNKEKIQSYGASFIWQKQEQIFLNIV